jgi:hypothetical protein
VGGVGCSTCGGNVTITYEGLDFKSETICLDLTGATNNDVITFTYDAGNRPNRFLIRDNGVTVASTPWVGSTTGYDPEDYFYPTGSGFGNITFTYYTGHVYELVVDTAPASITNPTSDYYQYSISCGVVPITEITECLTSMEFLVRYSNTRGSRPGGHTCDRGTFDLRANNITVGRVYLSNTRGSNDRLNYWPGETGGPDRYNSLTLTSGQVQSIAAASTGGVIQLALVCVLPDCHNEVNWVTVRVNGKQIFDGYPVGNFAKINACTGAIVP